MHFDCAKVVVMSAGRMRKEESELLAKRVEKVLRAEPDLCVKTLAERFGVSHAYIRRVAKRIGHDVPITEYVELRKVKKFSGKRGKRWGSHGVWLT